MRQFSVMILAVMIPATIISYQLEKDQASKASFALSSGERQVLRDAPNEPRAALDPGAVIGEAKNEVKQIMKDKEEAQSEAAKLDEIVAQAAVQMHVNGVDVIGAKTATVEVSKLCRLMGCSSTTLVVFTKELPLPSGNRGINPIMSQSKSFMAIVTEGTDGRMSAAMVDQAKLFDRAP